MVVRWKNLMIQNKPAIEFAIVTKSTGYSSIAFNPSDKGMKNLDCYFGYMKSGNLVVADMWVNGLVEPKLDTAQGGKDSILAKNGGIANGEFTVSSNLNISIFFLVEISTIYRYRRFKRFNTFKWK